MQKKESSEDNCAPRERRPGGPQVPNDALTPQKPWIKQTKYREEEKAQQVHKTPSGIKSKDSGIV